MTALSQGIGGINLKENNRYLAEGAECKQLLHEKNREIRVIDSTLAEQKKVEENLNKQNANYEKSEAELIGSIYDQQKKYNKLADEYKDERAATEKERHKKVIWRGIAIPSSLIVIATIVITIILL